jgi:hypothetical protein
MVGLIKKWNTVQKTLMKTGFVTKKEEEGEYDNDPDMIRRQIHLKSRLEAANNELKTPIEPISFTKVSLKSDSKNFSNSDAFNNKKNKVQFKATVTVVAFYENEPSFDDQTDEESEESPEIIVTPEPIEVENDVEVLSSPPIPPKQSKPDSSRYEWSPLQVAPQPQGNRSAFINDSNAGSAVSSDIDWISNTESTGLKKTNLQDNEYGVPKVHSDEKIYTDDIIQKNDILPRKPSMIATTEVERPQSQEIEKQFIPSRKSVDEPRLSHGRSQEFVIVDSEPVVIPKRYSSLGNPSTSTQMLGQPITIPPRSRSLNKFSTPVAAY